MLDETKLENVKRGNGCIDCQCPACAETGADTAGDNLRVWPSGAFRCIVDNSQPHCKRIFALAGLHQPAPPPVARRPLPAKPPPRPAASKPRPLELRPLNVGEMARIAAHRRWPSFAGLELLTRRGLLWFGRVWDDGAEHDAWILADASRRNIRARRLDGQRWAGIGNAKEKALQGSAASWPIGLAESLPFPHIVLVEGGADFAAVLLVAWWGVVNVPPSAEVAPVMISGAGNNLPADALPYFARKAVTIMQHNDASNTGQNAAQRWASQLREAGAASICFANFGKVGLQAEPQDREQDRPQLARRCKDLADFATTLRLPEPDEQPVPQPFERDATA